MTTTPTDAEVQAAYHEVGHAVVGLAVGLPVDAIEIEATGSGWVYGDWHSPRLSLAAVVAGLEAGRCAEVEFLAAPPSLTFGRDRRLSEHLMEARGQWVRRAEISREAYLLARRIIRANAALVHRLADELIDRRELSGDYLAREFQRYGVLP